MHNNRGLAGFAALALLVAGCFLIPAQVRAAEAADSPHITALLTDAKAEALQLKEDSADLENFVRSKLSWESHATKIDMIKEHINNTGRLLTKLQDAEATGAPWQQTAIKRIHPLLKELAANMEATINHLNENRGKIHFPAFREYVKANFELATDLEALIKDFVNYGEAKREFERLGAKLEITG